MNIFEYTFSVPASIHSVAEFHRDPLALRKLTPPPVFVQMHKVEPQKEGSIADFTLWFGPLPVHWVAKHTHVDPLHGFSDTQVSGPMKIWNHRHTFLEESSTSTKVSEHIEYDHFQGPRGILSRILFNPIGLKFTFGYRKMMTCRILKKR